MKMNQRMSVLLRQADIGVPFVDDPALGTPSIPALLEVGEFVLLKNQYELNKHVSPADLPDKTGFECFINHVHFPFDGTSASLKSSLSYAIALQKALARIAKNRSFQVIISVDDHECTVRFHQLRQGEAWIAEDLEGYAEEAVLLLGTGQTTPGQRPLKTGDRNM
jgi:hypothetical protein